jgi:hypothetical protein
MSDYLAEQIVYGKVRLANRILGHYTAGTSNGITLLYATLICLVPLSDKKEQTPWS